MPPQVTDLGPHSKRMKLSQDVVPSITQPLRIDTDARPIRVYAAFLLLLSTIGSLKSCGILMSVTLNKAVRSLSSITEMLLV